MPFTAGQCRALVAVALALVATATPMPEAAKAKEQWIRSGDSGWTVQQTTAKSKCESKEDNKWEIFIPSVKTLSNTQIQSIFQVEMTNRCVRPDDFENTVDDETGVGFSFVGDCKPEAVFQGAIEATFERGANFMKKGIPGGENGSATILKCTGKAGEYPPEGGDRDTSDKV